MDFAGGSRKMRIQLSVIRIIRYPIPTWVWINRDASGAVSSFFLSVAINTRSDATLFSHDAPQSCCVMYLYVSTFPQFRASRHRSLYSIGVR